MTGLGGNVVGRGAAYIFVETTAKFLSGILLWFVLTRITSSDVIGTSSTAISLATMFTVIAAMGIPAGSSRFLAKSFEEKDIAKATVFFRTSLIIISLGILASSILLVVLRDVISVFQSDPDLLTSALIFICSTTLVNLYYSTILSTLKTKISSIVMIIASCSRTAVVIILILVNLGAFGIVIGYALCEVIACLLLAMTVSRILRSEEKIKSDKRLNYPLKTILTASVSSWIPKLIALLGGANLGTVIVFVSNGSTEAASYFLASSILNAILSTVTPLYAIAYPALSAMNDGRKRFTWKIIRLSTIISVPLSLSIIFYSDPIIDILGEDYGQASMYLRIFLITLLPSSVSIMVGQLSYSYGNYRQVLYLGLASSVPRVLFYFILVPYVGGTGAAISFLIGSMVSFILCVIVARNIGLNIHWKDLGIIIIVSLPSPLFFSYIEINFIIGIITSLIISIVIFLRFEILSRSDVQEITNVLPKQVALRLSQFINKVGSILNKDF